MREHYVNKFYFNSRTENQKDYYGKYLIPEQISRNVAIDLGSNVGHFSQDNFMEFDSIFAIDASYQNFRETLKRIMEINESDDMAYNVSCFNLAAAKNCGEVIKVYKHAWNGESVSCVTVSDMLTKQYGDVWYPAPTSGPNNGEPWHNVYTISLEGMYRFFDIDYIDYLKIDIEGAEYDFLLDKDLSKIGAMGLEIHGTLGKELKDKLKEHISKYFEIYDVDFDDPAPGHSVITYINKELV